MSSQDSSSGKEPPPAAAAAAAAAAERREHLEMQEGKKGPGSMSHQLFCTASEAAATYEPSVLPSGHTLVVAAKPHTTGQLEDKLLVPAPAADTAAPPLQPFSCLRCLTQPDVAAEPSLTQGYGRLQVLLAYLLPEVTETLEEEDPAALLQQQERPRVAAAAAAQQEKEGSHEEAAAAAAAEKEEAAAFLGSAGAKKSSSSAAVPQEFTVTAVNPTRGYVRISLNGVPVYRSSVLNISPKALNEAAAVLQGKKEEANLPQTIFNERIEIQVHEPYSVLRVELFNRDVTLGVIADDDLLGVFELPIHLLKPRKIYDIEAEFPPEILREENEEWISGQGLDSPFVLGEKRLLPAAATAQLLQTKQIFDPEIAAAAAADAPLPPVPPPPAAATASGAPGGRLRGEETAAEKAAAAGALSGAGSPKKEEERKQQAVEERATGNVQLQQEAREAAAAAHAKLKTSGSAYAAGTVDLLSCPLNLAAAAAASAPQMGGLRSSSFSLESRSTTVDEADLTTAAVATGAAAALQQQQHVFQHTATAAAAAAPDTAQEKQQQKDSRPALLPLGCCACGPRLRCLFKMEIIGASSLARVGLTKTVAHGVVAAAELCALALPLSINDAAAAARLPPVNFRKLFHDVKRLKYLVWDCVLERVTEAVGLLPTWRRPLLSAVFLSSIVLVTLQPVFLYPLCFFFLGLLLLLLAQTSLSSTPAAAVAAASVLTDAKRKPPPAAVLRPGTAAAAAAKKDLQARSSSSQTPPPPPSLQAFEEQQQSDETRLEDSLLKGLLSSAIPTSISRRLRVLHGVVLAAIAFVLRMHHKLRMRRELVVGFLWLLSLFSFYFPQLIEVLIRYSIGGAGVLVMLRQMPVVGTTLRLIVACVSYARLLYERAAKQHLVAAPVVLLDD